MSSYGGRGPTINGVLWSETALAAVFVFARLYTRKFILRTQGLDDLFLILAWVSGLDLGDLGLVSSRSPSFELFIHTASDN